MKERLTAAQWAWLTVYVVAMIAAACIAVSEPPPTALMSEAERCSDCLMRMLRGVAMGTAATMIASYCGLFRSISDKFRKED